MNVYRAVGVCFIPLALALAVCVGPGKALKGRDAAAAAAAGLLGVVPITMFQILLSGVPLFQDHRLVSVLVTVLVFNGLIEETVKMGVLFLLPPRPAGVTMLRGGLAGLALGCFETLVYAATGHGTFLLRLFTAVLIHTECAALSSLTVAARRSGVNRLLPFVTSVLVHGVYNFFASLPSPLWWFSIASLLLGAVQCRVQWKTGKEEGMY